MSNLTLFLESLALITGEFPCVAVLIMRTYAVYEKQLKILIILVTLVLTLFILAVVRVKLHSNSLTFF